MSGAVIFEEHSSVLAHWLGLGVRDATLVYLDAHLDLQFIEEARIARLAACGNAGELAQLEGFHCLSPERDACYGIEDFLYAAGRLGMLRRVVWVAPPHVIKGGMGAALGMLTQMEGVAIEDLESFRALPGGVLEGRLLGLDLTICAIGQLASLALHPPVLVDIDADYFLKVPGDAVWAQPRATLEVVKAVAEPGAALTIARSVGSGFMPQRYRCIADLLAALWEGRQDDAHQWQQVLDSGGDPAGQFDLLRRLGEFRARGLHCDETELRGLHTQVEREQDLQRRRTAWVSLGLLFAGFGRLAEAEHCHAQSRSGGAGHPELALEIAKLHMQRGAPQRALPLLERAAADDETRVSAWLHLAECALAAGQPRQAWELASRAHKAAPAWPLPLQRMAACANAAGDAVSAGAFLSRHRALERRLQAVGEKLA